HIDGYSFVSVGDQETIDICVNRAKQQGCLLSVDASVPAVRTCLDFTRQLFEKADFCFANQKEVLAITGARSLREAIHSLHPSGQKLWVIKQGPRGATVITCQGSFRVPSFRVEVVDTIAAGDTFIAAFLTSLCKGEDLGQSALRGSAAGALACKGSGSLTYRFGMSDVDNLIRESK
ncbi:MAG: PfkB family carbohydrate kinase, partial [Anaerolineales bacterium]